MSRVPYTGLPQLGDAVYEHGPDSFPREDVAQGTVVDFTIDDSIVFSGTRRRVWVHMAAGHRTDEPAAVMIFNDGWWYLDPEGDVRGGVVLDNLASDGSIPPLVGVFIDPGVKDTTAGTVKNRNVEYDAFDGRYAEFVITEVLPRVSRIAAISDRGDHRGICGGSSGGNCAFTAAWTASDAISRVIAFNSSFAQMPHGNPYPDLLAAGSSKAIRVFLHTAQRDLNWDRPDDNWFAESLRVAVGLAEGGYDFRLVVGDAGHSPQHGGVLLPDALRWLWA